ncbi:hypothetical protein [Pseudoalteromonas sp. MMG022]|uniref:hypothetical protein n=1 Tax=Pseudoalteromonas sp. MMG022 TaxID=2909978 RepID=UPI001F2320DD|nr:hypothetical protein [Pseudoalteromonas sp. MMG022]MCF6436388.1 hypothetical protein [Pseudoalteromonas sp. MMG022]
MNKLLLAAGILACSSSVFASVIDKTVSVDQEALLLTTADFTPITTVWAGRTVVTGYQALVDVQGAQSALFFDASGEVSARWFASNFSLVTKMSCNGVPVGMSKAYGKRVDGQSTPAQPIITELRKGVEGCTQLKIELSKEGSLSRQFYTRIQDISFTVAVKGFNSPQGAL